MIQAGAPSNQIGYKQQLTNNIAAAYQLFYFIYFQNNTHDVYVGHGWIVLGRLCWLMGCLSSF